MNYFALKRFCCRIGVEPILMVYMIRESGIQFLEAGADSVLGAEAVCCYAIVEYTAIVSSCAEALQQNFCTTLLFQVFVFKKM